MTAKEYLSQIRVLDTKINQRLRQQEELKEIIYSVSSINTEDEKVKGGVKNSYNKIDKYIDMEQEIDNIIDEFVDLKNKIIWEIHQLKNPLFLDILYKKYVEFKTLELIAVEMNYNYNYVRRKHGEALKYFDKIILTGNTK